MSGQEIVKVPQLEGKYFLQVNPISNGAGHWNSSRVEIMDSETKSKLGEYTRNYGTLYSTFCPFIKGGKEYALYSESYMQTSVMTLPDCKHLCSDSTGFCPTDYYVPQPNDGLIDGDVNQSLDGSFGFLAGCFWGDDSSWKIRYLDLSEIEQGKIKNDDRFGYIELDDNDSLKDAISLRYYEKDDPVINIRSSIRFSADYCLDINFGGLVNKEYESQEDKKNPSRIAKCIHCGHIGKQHILYPVEHKIYPGQRVCSVYEESKKEKCDCKDFKLVEEEQSVSK